MKRFFRALFELRSILLGITCINFAFFYAKAVEAQLPSEITRYCFSPKPWFIESYWSYLPHLLLISAFALYFRKWWSYFVSFASCSIAIYWCGAALAAEYGFVTWFYWMLETPDFFFQFLLAGFILIYGIWILCRKQLTIWNLTE